MNPETRVERLQSLLERVQRNAASLADQRERAASRALSSPTSSRRAGSAAISAQPQPAVARAAQHQAERSAPDSADELAWEPPVTHLPPVQPKPITEELPGDEPALEIEVAEDLSDELGEEDLLTIPPSQPPPDAGETLQGMPPAPAAPREASSLPPARDSHLPAHSGPVPTATDRPSREPLEAADDDAAPDDELRTPPPESGPQITSPTHADELAPAGAEESSSDIELASDVLPSSPQSYEDEAALPRKSFPAQYDASLAPPPNARDELAAHDQQHRPRQDTRQDDGLFAPPPEAAALDSRRAPDRAHARSAVRADQPVAAYEGARPASPELTFLQRLERTLALGR